jgi:hemolysin III
MRSSAASALSALPKPRLRGVVHQWSFFVALIAGALLVAIAPTALARLAAGIYAFGLCALLGASALYHRGNWSARVEPWMRRLDHSMIFVLIAGTYTPIALLALHGTFARVLLFAVWAGAAAGIVFSVLWIEAPAWLVAIVYVALGWFLVAAFPAVLDSVGPVGFGLIAGGGLLYTVGAVVYARARPDPIPTVFGYHEVFHVLVVAAAALHYAAIVGFVLPSA